MQRDLTTGNITGKLLCFAFPLMLGNLLQQLYNVADTWIVGRFLGPDALASVGSSYTLMVFLTSILLGLCMGSGAVFSIQYGKREEDKLKNSIFISFSFIVIITLLLNLIVYLFLDQIVTLLRVPPELVEMMKDYLEIIFAGIMATFLYNYFANLLRAVGNSVTPLAFLGVSAVLNIVLDLLFVITFQWGVKGAAIATVIAQYVAGIGIMLYTLRNPKLRIKKQHMRWNSSALQEITKLSFLTCIQQSVMNLGILMVQGLINSFGTVVMAAFAAAVKIDSFAYMPVQDFGNAFSTYTAQNFGAKKTDRIEKGIRSAIVTSTVFCILISTIVCIFAKPLMELFIPSTESEIIAVGVSYLRIEASFYLGIGLLFLFYGFYRAIKKPGISVILTVLSLGTRVILAYFLSSIPSIGVIGIWVSVPIGWLLADFVGFLYYLKYKKNQFSS